MTRLEAAAAAYRAAVIAAHNAATRSRLTRRDRDATDREIARANQASRRTPVDYTKACEMPRSKAK